MINASDNVIRVVYASVAIVTLLYMLAFPIAGFSGVYDSVDYEKRGCGGTKNVVQLDTLTDRDVAALNKNGESSGNFVPTMITERHTAYRYAANNAVMRLMGDLDIERIPPTSNVLMNVLTGLTTGVDDDPIEVTPSKKYVMCFINTRDPLNRGPLIKTNTPTLPYTDNTLTLSILKGSGDPLPEAKTTITESVNLIKSAIDSDHHTIDEGESIEWLSESDNDYNIFPGMGYTRVLDTDPIAVVDDTRIPSLDDVASDDFTAQVENANKVIEGHINAESAIVEKMGSIAYDIRDCFDVKVLINVTESTLTFRSQTSPSLNQGSTVTTLNYDAGTGPCTIICNFPSISIPLDTEPSAEVQQLNFKSLDGVVSRKVLKSAQIDHSDMRHMKNTIAQDYKVCEWGAFVIHEVMRFCGPHFGRVMYSVLLNDIVSIPEPLIQAALEEENFIKGVKSIVDTTYPCLVLSVGQYITTCLSTNHPYEPLIGLGVDTTTFRGTPVNVGDSSGQAAYKTSIKEHYTAGVTALNTYREKAHRMLGVLVDHDGYMPTPIVGESDDSSKILLVNRDAVRFTRRWFSAYRKAINLGRFSTIQKARSFTMYPPIAPTG